MEMLMTNIIKKSAAEAIGTFALVFAGCGSMMVIERFPGSMSLSAVPLVFGLVVAAMIYAVGHISGAHFNPAVTLAFAVARHFPWKQTIAYWLAQFAGAGAAICLLRLSLPEGLTYGAAIPHLGAAATLGWETVLSFFLMFVIIAVATDTRAEGTMAGTAIGATIAVCAFIGGPVTGASMNPARALAPALMQGTVGSLWIYLTAPPIGAVLAALVYDGIRCAPEAKTAKGCC